MVKIWQRMGRKVTMGSGESVFIKTLEIYNNKTPKIKESSSLKIISQYLRHPLHIDQRPCEKNYDVELNIRGGRQQNAHKG